MCYFPVPEPPSAVKALVMTGESILVSWKPPTQPNGVVVQYTVYVKEESEEAKDVSDIIINSERYFTSEYNNVTLLYTNFKKS